jgi:hypothetical protein
MENKMVQEMWMTEPFMHIRPGSKQNKYTSRMAIRSTERPATGLPYAYSTYSYTIYHRTIDITIPTTFSRPLILIKPTEVHDNFPCS